MKKKEAGKSGKNVVGTLERLKMREEDEKVTGRTVIEKWFDEVAEVFEKDED